MPTMNLFCEPSPLLNGLTPSWGISSVSINPATAGDTFAAIDVYGTGFVELGVVPGAFIDYPGISSSGYTFIDSTHIQLNGVTVSSTPGEYVWTYNDGTREMNYTFTVSAPPAPVMWLDAGTFYWTYAGTEPFQWIAEESPDSVTWTTLYETTSGSDGFDGGGLYYRIYGADSGGVKITEYSNVVYFAP